MEGAALPECVLEAEAPCGTKLRIHLKAAATQQVATLGRMLWRERIGPTFLAGHLVALLGSSAAVRSCGFRLERGIDNVPAGINMIMIGWGRSPTFR